MARNRRNQTTGVRLAPMVKVLLLCAFLGGSAVGYVLQKNKLHQLGKAIKDREIVLERVRWENKIRAEQLADLQLPQRLVERVRRDRLGLTAPPPARIIWLAEPQYSDGRSNGLGLLVLRQTQREAQTR